MHLALGDFIQLLLPSGNFVSVKNITTAVGLFLSLQLGFLFVNLIFATLENCGWVFQLFLQILFAFVQGLISLFTISKFFYKLIPFFSWICTLLDYASLYK